MSTLNVNTINAATSGQAVAVDVQNPRSFRNLIINGEMQVAQRGTSSTSSGIHTVDRWTCNFDGGSVTQSQGTETSGTVFEKGFRNYLRITNTGNTTTSSHYRFIQQSIEAQYLSNSGWNYNSASSYLTLSFWVRSSVAGTYFGFCKASDGTEYYYPFSTGAISANTWTKITKKIPGNSNLTINNDNGEGLSVHIAAWYGTNYTDDSTTLDTWATMDGGKRGYDYDENWANTSNATFDLTGVQLEVSEYATDFEHRTYADDLSKCQRYYQNSYAAGNVPGTSNANANAINLLSWADGNVQGFTFMGRMRAAPSVILRSPNATTVARLDSSGTDRVAAAQDVNDHHVKYISVTSGSGNSWASVCYELVSDL